MTLMRVTASKMKDMNIIMFIFPLCDLIIFKVSIGLESFIDGFIISFPDL